MLMASTYTVQRETTIAAPPEQIYPHVASFQRWRAWSPWEGLDPDLERRYEGPEAGVGSVYAWSGNRKAGTGRMEIVEASEPTEVVIALTFEKPFKSQTRTVVALTPVDGGTRATWTMTGPQTFMLKVMSVVMTMDKMIGPDFEKGLAQLKTTAETSAPPAS